MKLNLWPSCQVLSFSCLRDEWEHWHHSHICPNSSQQFPPISCLYAKLGLLAASYSHTFTRQTWEWHQSSNSIRPKRQTVHLTRHHGCMAGFIMLHCVNCVTLCRATIPKKLINLCVITTSLTSEWRQQICKAPTFAFRHQFAEHYANISLTKYIYISYETCAFTFAWATLQTRQVRLLSQMPHAVWTVWRSSCRTCCMSACVEYGSIKSWQLKRKEGCEMVGGYIPPVLHSFLYNFKSIKS